ncbi:MAG: hypothetical protein MK365_17725, partial [Vicinamibacterales bacterium]|nr:hypothetical protein [Vicinamibacterales bacterium]
PDDKASGAETMRIDRPGTYPGSLIGSSGSAGTVILGASEVNLGDFLETEAAPTVSVHQAQQAEIDALQLVVEAATAEDGNTQLYTLVKRDPVTGTKIDNLHVVADTVGYDPSGGFPPAGLYFTQGTCTGDLELLDNAQLVFVPVDNSGNSIDTRHFVFGRAEPYVGETTATSDEKRDGLLIEDTAVGISTEIMCSNSLPTLRMKGDKATTTTNNFVSPVCPVVEIQNGADETTFAVYDDGFVVAKGHHRSDVDALNSGHFSTVVTGDGSVYIGSARISYNRTTNEIEWVRLKNQIPVYLAALNFQDSDISPLGTPYAEIPVHTWIVFARLFTGNMRLTARDVFPAENSDWRSLTINTGRLVTPVLQAPLGGAFKVLKVEQMLANAGSVWLGDKLHISETGTRAQLQIRNETIPVYAAAQGVVLADVTALGKTLANATLADWVALSVAAGGSDDLGVIFPEANQAVDFELRTILNELIVRPQASTGLAGITVDQPGLGHPCIFLRGNADGRGLIEFSASNDPNSDRVSHIYSSSFNKNFHIEHDDGTIVLKADRVDLENPNCTLTRGGDVFTTQRGERGPRRGRPDAHRQPRDRNSTRYGDSQPEQR